MTYSDFLKESIWLLNGEYTIWDILILLKKNICCFVFMGCPVFYFLYLATLVRRSLQSRDDSDTRQCESMEVMRNGQIMVICGRKSQLNLPINRI